jgi:aspartate/methionine/tyrosine aminotransferase
MTLRFDLGLGTIAPGLVGHTETWKTQFVAYGPRGGFEPLRRVLAQKEGVAPNCVIVTSGASMALTAALAILPKNRVILMPRPYYPAYPNVARFLGLEVAFYDLAPGRLLAEAVSDAAHGRAIGAIMVNTPGNPLGNIAAGEDMAALERIAHEAGTILIVDETYAGILLDPAANAWSGTGAAPGIVRLKSLSKAYLLAGERIGYAVAEPNLADKIEEAHWVIAMSPAVTSQTNAARALLEEVPERLAELCARLRRSRDFAIAALADIPGLEIRPPLAGVFLWIVFPTGGLAGVDIAHYCGQYHGLAVMPGEACGQSDPPAIRASFALPEVDAANAFHALSNALRELGTVSKPLLGKREP